MSDIGDVRIRITPEEGAGDAVADQFVDELGRSLGPQTSAAVNRAVAEAARKLKVGSASKSLGRDMATAVAGVVRAVREAERGLDRLETKMAAVRRTFAGTRVDADALLLDPAALARAERQLDLFAENRERAFSDPEVRKALTAETSAIVRTLEVQAKEIANLSRVWEEESRSQRESMRVTQQSASRIAKAEAGERVAIAQQEGARIIAETRASGSRRVALIQAFAQQIRAAERGLAAVFRTTSNAIGTLATSGARSLGRLGSSFRRSNADVATGLSGPLSTRERIMSSSFRRQETILSSSITRQQQSIQRLERTLSTGVLGAATGRGATGAIFPGLGVLAGGAGALGLLTSGFQRFSELERIQKQFTALLRDEQEALQLIAQLKDFAKITPFDLVGVSDLAKGFLAIGFAAEDVLPAVRTISDAVALTGGSTDALVRIQRAIGQVVSAGRLQGDELNQLAENLPGLNIRQLLADQLTGGDVQALVAMQEAGKLTADKFVSGLLTGLGTDPRLVGAAQDLATTLSGRLANLKEAFADFGASIIGLVAKPVASAFRIINDALAEATAFVRGEGLSDTLESVRLAAGGAALAIGGLLVARAAGQALQILALGLRAVLTPFGVLGLVLGGLGAVIAIAVRDFPALRLAFEQLGETIGRVVSPVVDFVSEKFDRFRLLLAAEIIPAIADFGSKLISGALRQARRFADFFETTVLPKLRSFVDFVTGELIPEIRVFASAAFRVLTAAIRLFWAKVEPIIAPAIDGIGELVGAVRDLFDVRPGRGFLALGTVIAGVVGGFAAGGPLGALIGGLGGTVAAAFITGLDDELAGAVAGIGKSFLNAIRPAVEAVVDFVRETFSIANLQRLAGGFLNLMQTIGRIIGSIVSDPAFVSAVAGIVGFALAAGGKFLLGFAQGVIENVPELTRMLRDALAAAVDALTTLDLPDFGALLLGLLGGAALLLQFRRRGQQIGQAIANGMKEGSTVASFAGGGIGGSGARGLLSGIFGTLPQIEAQARTAAARAATAFRREFDRNNRVLQAAGRAPIALSPLGDIQSLRDSRTAIQDLGRDLGDARLAGLRFRTAVQDAGRALTSRSFDGSRLRALGTAIGDLRASLQGQGRNVGAAVGASMAGAIGVAFSAQLAIEGESMGDRVLGLAGILGSVAGAFAIGGLPAAAIAGGLGLITTAIVAGGEAARKAKEEVQEYYDALAAQEGGTAVLDATAVVLNNIKTETQTVKDLLIEAGFDAEAFARRTAAGVSSAETVFADLASALGEGEIARRLDEGTASAQDLIAALRNDSPAVADFAEKLAGMGVNANDLSSLLDFLNDESGELGTALRNLSQDVANDNAFLTLIGHERLAEEALRGLPNAAADAFEGRVENPLAHQLDDAAIAAGDLEIALDDAKTAFRELIEGSGGRNAFKRQIDELIVSLPRLADQLKENLGKDLTLDVGLETSGQNLILDEFRTGIADALTEGIDTGAIRGVPGLQAKLDNIEAAIKLVIPRGQARRTLLGVVDELRQDKALSDAAKTAANAAAGVVAPEFDGADVGRTMSGDLAGGLTGGESEVGGAASGLAGSARSNAQADLYTTGLAAALGLASGIRAGGSSVESAAREVAQRAVNAARDQLNIRSPSLVFREIGQEIGRGLVAGLDDSSNTIVSAVESAIDAAIEAARRRVIDQVAGATLAARLFEALAPSRLPGQGRESDIQRSLIAVNEALDAFADLRRATNEELDNLRLSIQDSRRAANEARKEFERSAGDRAAEVFGRGDDRSAIAVARNNLAGLRSTLIDSNRELAERIAEANRTPAGERTIEQQRLAGGNRRSLDPTTAIGRANRESILTAGGDIRAFAQQLLAAGRPIGEVVAEVRRLRGELVAGTRALGFNQEEVQRLLRSLGLTDDQLRNFRESLRRANEAAREEMRRVVREANERLNEDLERLRELARTQRSLDPTNEQGRATRSALLDALQNVRDFGTELLNAGTPVATVVARMRELRNQIIRTARAMGLNEDQVLALVRSMGLSNEQLNEFVRQLNDANRERREGGGQPTVLPPPIVNIYPPYGDPEAIGLTAVNRMAAALT